MKTLVINGSPKKNGDAQALLDAFLEELKGEVRVVTWQDDISPCIDCRACWTKPGCAIKDGMEEVYRFHAQCDNVVLLSPIWFSSLSGPLLNIASRFQTLFTGRFRRGEKQEANKNSVLMLVGAQKETVHAPREAAMVILRTMQAKVPPVAEVYSLNTDRVPAKTDAEALQLARDAAKKLNEICGK